MPFSRHALVGACALFLLGACATADPNARTTQQERIIVTSDGAGTVADVAITRQDYVGNFGVKANRDRVWPHMSEVYQQLGLPAPAIDAGSMTVAVQNHTARRALGGVRMSDLIDCGADMTGRVADTYRIRLSVRTWLQSAGGEFTNVHTRVDASANSPERPDVITCSSRGALEKRIAEALETRATQ